MRTATNSTSFIAALAVAAIGCADGAGAGPDAGPDAGPAVFVLGEIAQTADGPIGGTIEAPLVVFRGVPYAAPPVGDLRFRPPQPPEPWSEPLAATAFGPACPQATDGYGATDEDCLTLNVWAHAAGGGRPVLVFVHGGGFHEGSSASPTYDGRDLAIDTGAVVVTLNYRLGALGWLATDALAAESGDGAAGNWGLRDAIAALEWVRANAARLGGDPERTLLFGQSAGGIAVCALAAAPAADGLYSALAMASGPCHVVGDLHAASWTGIAAAAAGAAFAEAVGCGGADQVACLRALPAADLVAAQATPPAGAGKILGVWLAPTIDGVTLPAAPLAALEAAAVPVVVGATRDEMTVFLADLEVPDAATYAAYVAAFFGAGAADALLAEYPSAAFATPKDALLALLGDAYFNCPAEGAARAHAAAGPTRLYAFDRPWGGAWAPYGAFHGIDLVSLYGTFASYGCAPTDADRAVGSRLRAAWGSLAATGAPGIAAWPEFAPDDPGSFLRIDEAGEGQGDLWREGRCAALRAIGVTP